MTKPPVFYDTSISVAGGADASQMSRKTSRCRHRLHSPGTEAEARFKAWHSMVHLQSEMEMW